MNQFFQNFNISKFIVTFFFFIDVFVLFFDSYLILLLKCNWNIFNLFNIPSVKSWKIEINTRCTAITNSELNIGELKLFGLQVGACWNHQHTCNHEYYLINIYKTKETQDEYIPFLFFWHHCHHYLHHYGSNTSTS